MTSVEAAFADGPFGSSVAPAASDSREAAKESAPAEKPAPQREAAEPSVSAKTDAPANDSREGEGDDEGELDLGGQPPNSENLYKALKSERSLTKQQRKEIKATLDRLERIELERRQDREQLFALQQQLQPKADEKKPEDPLDEYYADPAAFARKAADERARQAEDRIAQVEERFHRRLIDNSEEAFVRANPDARKHIDTFKQLASQTTIGPDGRQYLTPEAARIRQQLADVAEGRSKDYRDPAQYAHDYAKAYSDALEMSDPVAYRAKVRAEIEAELRGEKPGGGETRSQESRRTPLTLAGHRGSGASATPAREHTPVEKTFAF